MPGRNMSSSNTARPHHSASSAALPWVRYSASAAMPRCVPSLHLLSCKPAILRLSILLPLFLLLACGISSSSSRLPAHLRFFFAGVRRTRGGCCAFPPSPCSACRGQAGERRVRAAFAAATVATLAASSTTSAGCVGLVPYYRAPTCMPSLFLARTATARAHGAAHNAAGALQNLSTTRLSL